MRDVGAGGLHHSRDHLMLVVLGDGDGDHGDRHVRDACAGNGDRRPCLAWWWSLTPAETSCRSW